MGNGHISNLMNLAKKYSAIEIKYTVVLLLYGIVVLVAFSAYSIGMVYAVIGLRRMFGNYAFLIIPVVVLMSFVVVAIGNIIINQFFTRVIEPIYETILNVLNAKSK